jgi:hypothetical protein
MTPKRRIIFRGAMPSLIDPQAQAFYDRVIADGGTVPAGLAGTNAWFKAVKSVYGVSDISTAIASGIDPHHLGYKLGAGSGATLGSAAQTCYNAIGVAGDVVQTTATSQPLILPHTGTNYVWLPGVTGNYFSSPSAVANRFRNDIDYKICVQANSYTTAADFIGRYSNSATSRGFTLDITAAGILRLYFRFAGDVIVSSTASLASVGITAGTQVWLRATRNATNGEIKFFYSLNTFTTAPSSVTWTQLGTTIISTTGTTTGTSDTPIGIGTYTPEVGASTFVGKIYRATMSSTIDGAAVVDFNPQLYNRSISQTTITASTSEVYTLNTPSTTNTLKSAIVDRTYLMSNGTSIGMRAASLSIDQIGITGYTAFRKFITSGSTQMISDIGNTLTSQGVYLYIPAGANLEEIGVKSNVGQYVVQYNSTGLGLKLATRVHDITQSNEAAPYLINNVSQSINSTPVSSNNTTNVVASDYNILSRNNAASLFSNIMFACDIISKNADNTIIQTAFYTALKPFLVNAI